MAKYVMSDIHGMYDKYIEMLKKIGFSSDDTLYILGDIIDRGADSMEIYKHIISNDNIILLKGNHELLFEDFCNDSVDFAYSNWRFNGGSATKKSMYRNKVMYKEFLQFVKKLPTIMVVDGFILAHASIYTNPPYTDHMDLDMLLEIQNEEQLLWDRSDIGEAEYKDYQFIFGHTPTETIEKDRNTILHINNSYYIDCGACFQGGQLACLRLDDLKEFYV